MTWSDHIAGIYSKDKQILGMLYRQFYNNSSPETLKQLYLSLFRPHLEYSNQLWDLYIQQDINQLESVQKFALKLIYHRWESGYEELISLVNISKLSNRRLHLKLAQVSTYVSWVLRSISATKVNNILDFTPGYKQVGNS